MPSLVHIGSALNHAQTTKLNPFFVIVGDTMRQQGADAAEWAPWHFL